MSKLGNHLTFCDFALNSTIPASTGNTPFELEHRKNMILSLDHLKGATLPLCVNLSGEIAEECLNWLVVRQELGIA